MPRGAHLVPRGAHFLRIKTMGPSWLFVFLTLFLCIFTLIYVRRRVTGKLYQPRRTHTKRLIKLSQHNLYINTITGNHYYSKPPVGEYIHLWWIREWPNNKSVLYFHGNSYNISYREYMIKICKLLKLNLLLVDYRGYGRSDGKPSSSNILRDAKLACNFLLTRTEPSNIIIWGESLGGTPATYAASRIQCSNLLLFSTFASLHELISSDTPMSNIIYSLVRAVTQDIDYDTNNVEFLSKVTSPVLIMHSKGDTLIPYANAEKLYDSVKHSNKSLMTIEGDHASPKLTLDNIRSMVAFLDLKTSDETLVKVETIINNLEW